jgi:hypothetical protein
MLDEASYSRLKRAIRQQIADDHAVLDQLRAEISDLRQRTRRIQPRETAAVSLVATDGGNNQLKFDPFLVQLIRVVDSNQNEYCVEAVSPTQDITVLEKRHISAEGEARSALGELMQALSVRRLTELSPMLRPPRDDRPPSPSWVQVYREVIEWAFLHKLLGKDYGSDTLIVFDGLLRSKVFAGDLLSRYGALLQAAIKRQWEQRRRIYLVGLAKSSKVLTRYRLAMALEQILRTPYPAHVEIPREIEEKAYVWAEYARGDDRALEGGEVNKFVLGKMFFVKFGAGVRDPIWPVDIFLPQQPDADRIFGYLLNDAINGFPVALYPRSLQKAHEHAAIVGFDLDMVQDIILDELREALGSAGAGTLDAFRLEDADPSQRRYG